MRAESAGKVWILERIPKVHEAFPLVVSAPEEIRTPNLLIRSQMLYPLSYGRLFCCRPA